MKHTACFREFAKYSSLNVLGMIGLSCYILADTFFVAKSLGANGLAALNLAIPVYSFLHGSGLMIGMGGATRYAILKSQKNSQGADRMFTHAILLAAGFALFFMLAGGVLSGPIVTLFGADENVFEMTKTYVQVILLFAPAFLLNNVLLCFVRNDGAPHRSMAAMIGGSLSNIVLDYVFLFPLNMGIFGAVLATGLAPVISMLILSPHFLKKKNGFHVRKGKPEGKLAMQICSCGVPSLVTEMSSGVVMIAFNTILLRLQGNVGVAAYGVIANLSLVVIAVYTGVAQGIQPLLSRNYGEGNRAGVHAVLRWALGAMLILSAILVGAVFFGASPIAAAFNSEHDALLQNIAVEGLRLYFLACPFAGFNIILSVFFTSTELPRPAQILSLLRGFAVILPAAFLLSAAFGTTGVWCAFPATELSVACLGAAYVLLHRRRNLVP